MNRTLRSIPTLIFIFIVGLTTGIPVLAQDTIRVQTFTLDDNFRAGVFEFPDDGQTYEKILLRYRMRCHDAAVGNGNVGCREWDYSCNTFITDSTRIDSNLAFHPNAIVSNFSGDTFFYTSQQTYTYFQFLQRDVVITNTISESISTVGNGASTIPLGGAQPVGRSQFLFKASELLAAGVKAGPIDGMLLNLAQPGSDANSLRIRLRSTSQTTLNSAAPELEGFTEMYFRNTAFPAAGPQRFNFYNYFFWDGSSNLLVEFSYTNSAAGQNTVLAAHDAGFTAGLTSAEPDYGLLFSGSGSAPVGATSLSGISNQITISLWAKGTPEIMPVNNSVLEGRDAAGNRQANVHLPWGNGQVYWDCGNDGAGYDRINKQANEADYEGRWNHWTFTKNATTGSMKIYLNGVLWHSGTGKSKSIDLNDLRLGANAVGGNPYYGAVDEFQIWDVELDGPAIQAWMRKPIDPAHPFYQNLRAYYRLNEGSGLQVSDASPVQQSVQLSGVPGWERIRGNDLFQNFTATAQRPDISFIQGEFIVDDQFDLAYDSVPNAPNQVIVYSVASGSPVAVDTFFAYRTGDMPVYDETNALVGFIPVAAENALPLGRLLYYNRFPAKYEILSLVTPYGNGLDLGPEGKVFTFDVTDYAPILRGKKRLSIEMGGENQEELDLQFLFITGTPPRPVLNVQNIWPFRRGEFADIQNDNVFEPRTILPDAGGSAFKIRASITGHAQNGEFVKRTHYFDVNGGPDEFTFDVWKKCGDIPIYPQGGTWLFDRAGWCPGDPTVVHEFDITSLVSPGVPATIDYGVLGAFMADANYLVSNQLVTYGPPSHVLDAAAADIVRPSRKVEHERFNPACNRPVVRIQNTGATPLTTLTLHYRVAGGQSLTHQWTGNLAFLETEDVVLPVPNMNFWSSSGGQSVFQVEISNPNGQADGYLNNNALQSEFAMAEVLSGEIVLNYKTNNRGSESAMFLRDHTGAVVLQRTGMANNTTYTDELNLPAGCYTLEFTDSGNDGLYYWYWEAIGQNVGAGFLRFRRRVNTVLATIKTFEPEFGSFVHFDFVIPQTVGANEPLSEPSLLSVYPNPAADVLNVELSGYPDPVFVELCDATGRLLERQEVQAGTPAQILQFTMTDHPKGLYFIRVNDGRRVKTRPVTRM